MMEKKINTIKHYVTIQETKLNIYKKSKKSTVQERLLAIEEFLGLK